MTVQSLRGKKCPKIWIQEVKGTNVLSKLWYFMSFEIKDFLRFSNIIYFHLRFTSWIHIFKHFCWQTLNCHFTKTVRAFDLIPTLRARPKYQLSSGSLVVEDYTQQNRWDYTQQNRDWAALESFKSNLWVLIVKKVVLSNQKTQVFHRSVATELSKNAG